jgi:hypothetical protein
MSEVLKSDVKLGSMGNEIAFTQCKDDIMSAEDWINTAASYKTLYKKIYWDIPWQCYFKDEL